MSDKEKNQIGYLGDWVSSIPNKIIKNNNLTLEARFFWTLVKSFASSNSPVPFPSISYLSKLANCSTNRVTKYLEELEDKGYLYRSKKVGKKTLYIISPKKRNFSNIDDKKLRNSVEKENLSYLKNSNMNNSNMKSSKGSITHNKDLPKDKEGNNSSTFSLSKKEVNKIITKWNNTVNQINNNLKERNQDIRMSKVRDINYSTKRYRHLKKRVQENSFDFDEICNALLDQDFCWGLNDRTWQADFDWLIKNGENYVKVLERKFRSNSKPKKDKDKNDITEGGKYEVT